MGIMMIDTVKRNGAQELFLKELGLLPGNEDAERLCRIIRLIDQARAVAQGAEWEEPTVGLFKKQIEQIARRNGLSIVYSDRDDAFVKMGRLPINRDDTLKLVGANVWEW